MPESRKRKNLARFARGFTWFCVAASILAFAGKIFWLFDLFAEFRLQLAVAGMIAGVVWAFHKRWLLAGAGALSLAANLIEIFPLYRHVESGPVQGKELRIVQANLFYLNPDVTRIQSYLEGADADIVCLYEFSRDQRGLKTWLQKNYPYSVDAPLVDDARSALYSRYPLKGAVSLVSAFTLRQGVRTTAVIDGKEIDFFVVHPTIPIYPGAADGRNGQLDEVASLAAASRNPAIMVGDFNITPFSAYFPPKKYSELKDLGQGHGLLPTFPVFMPPLMVPIDHMFATKGVRANRRTLGQFIASDHLPVVTDLVIPD